MAQLWSFSQHRTFRKCPRQWFYSAQWADSGAKDPERREAAVLKKLQTVSGWRGQLVDQVFTDYLVPRVNLHRAPRLLEVKAEANRRFDLQLKFGRQHRIREEGMTAELAGQSFAAFIKLEYGESITDDDFVRARQDVMTALTNLYRKMDRIRELMRESAYCVAQRPLTFSFLDGSVRAVPDLIVFRTKLPPVIIDWKVHTFGNRDYADQLTGYALALVRCEPHKDFAKYRNGWEATDVRLVEAQLLLGTARRHRNDADAIAAAEERIGAGILELQAAMNGKRTAQLHPEDFPVTRRPLTCQACAYRKLCWK